MLVRIAWRNLWRGRRRSAIVLTAFTVGIGGTLVLVAWMNGMMFQMADNAIRARLAHVSVHSLGYDADPDPSNALPDGGAAALAVVRDLDGARGSARLVGDGLAMTARSSQRATVMGVDPLGEGAVSVIPAAVVEGEWLVVPEGTRSRRQLPDAVIGRTLAERLRVGVADKIVLQVPGDAGLGAFRVRGLFATASSEFDRAHVYVGLPDAQRLLAVDGATEVAIAFDDTSRAAAAQRLLRSRLGPDVEVLRWQERAPQLAALLDLIGSTAWIFYAAIFVAMAFGIANVLLMSVLERTREFGVLRSLGLTSRRLVALVLVESLLLSGLGVACGLGSGLVGCAWLAQTGIDLSVFAEALHRYGVGAVIYPRLLAKDLVAPAFLATTTAFVAALWPAIRVARLRPAEALRHS